MYATSWGIVAMGRYGTQIPVREDGGEVNEMEDSITYGIEFQRAGLASWVLTDHRYVTAEIAAKSWDYEIREGYARIVQITTTHTIVPWGVTQ